MSQRTIILQDLLTGTTFYRLDVQIDYSKMQTRNYKDFFPTKQTRIVALFFGDFLVSVGSCFGYNPYLFGRAEILVILGLHFGRNDDLINSFCI